MRVEEITPLSVSDSGFLLERFVSPPCPGMSPKMISVTIPPSHFVGRLVKFAVVPAFIHSDEDAFRKSGGRNFPAQKCELLHAEIVSL